MDHAHRLDAQVLVLDQAGGLVLLVLPAERPDWTLPGGGVIPGESVAAAARRALSDWTGLEREIGHGLVEDQVPQDVATGAPEGIAIVCDGGRMSLTEAGALSLPVKRALDIRALEWVPVDLLSRYTEPFIERRIRAAVAASLLGNRFPLLFRGELTNAT
ncbi:NUDIX domain-containing protein [Streptomyces sp. TLI_053]|uniref:NUDIX domain-containing protein n=1 Tax=Streptomyces sp. TLI_053 TaxID=1855352 RepID=UPI00087A34A1|nr:NUDIX domain-containing protein [Streptomyces sp. TLI_053]SDT11609.1 NUDIX domain-containing protein [Streptomyces sp. TLI_053]